MPAELSIAAVFGWPEIIGCLAFVLIFLIARRLMGTGNGLQRGLREFRKSSREVQEQLGISAKDAGRSVGGIYGKPAAEGLTHDNQVAEFYSIPPRDSAHSTPMTFSDRLVVFIAQGFGIGRIPFAPGTWGTLLGFVWAGLLLNSQSYWIYLVGTALGVLAAARICDRAEKIMNQRDPGSIVLDEIIAIPVCYLLPTTFLSIVFYQLRFPFSEINALLGRETTQESFGFIAYVASGMNYAEMLYSLEGWLFAGGIFLFFRLFDIWKPWPVRQSQSLPGGWGVVMDDVLAAVYVNLVALALYAIAYWLR